MANLGNIDKEIKDLARLVLRIGDGMSGGAVTEALNQGVGVRVLLMKDVINFGFYGRPLSEEEWEEFCKDAKKSETRLILFMSKQGDAIKVVSFTDKSCEKASPVREKINELLKNAPGELPAPLVEKLSKFRVG